MFKSGIEKNGLKVGFKKIIKGSYKRCEKW